MAADLLAELLPVSGGATHTTLRNRTFAVAQQIITHASERAAISEAIQPARALTLQLDHTYFPAAESESTRHLQVLTGEIEPNEGGRKPRFASLDDQRKPASIVREHLNQSGYTKHTALTALTDGEEGLRNIARGMRWAYRADFGLVPSRDPITTIGADHPGITHTRSDTRGG